MRRKENTTMGSPQLDNRVTSGFYHRIPRDTLHRTMGLQRLQVLAAALVCSLFLLLSGLHNYNTNTIMLRTIMMESDAAAAPLQEINLHSTVNIHQKKKSTKVGIAVVADRTFQTLQEPLFKTHRQYAARHSYEYHVLEPSPSCRLLLHDFFFQKHCTIREFLTRQEPGYTLFVLDGDVIVAAPNVTLDRWTDQDADILLYERD